MRLLDLFSGAGGAGMGYHRAGFEVVGVDIAPQPRYPFEFHQADALAYCAAHGQEFDVIHTSPPCQAYSITKSIHGNDHPALIEATRDALIATGKPYVIENVVGAPLRSPLMLCGSMFPSLYVYRHRLFECNPPLFMAPATCQHSFKMPASKGAYHELNGTNFITCVGHNFKASDGRIAMGIDWMTRAELSQAIPPAYCEYIGRQLRHILEAA
jgi:DNA (cytosine-5)-methyltransferase 1